MAQRKQNVIEAYDRVDDIFQKERQRPGVTVEETEHPVLGTCYAVSRDSAAENAPREYFVIEDFEDWKDEIRKAYGAPEAGYGKITFIEDTARGVYTTSLTDKNGTVLYLGQMDSEENLRVKGLKTDRETQTAVGNYMKDILQMLKEAREPVMEMTSYQSQDELLDAEKKRSGVTIKMISDGQIGTHYQVLPKNGNSAVTEQFVIIDFEKYKRFYDLQDNAGLPDKGYGKMTCLLDENRQVTSLFISGKDGQLFATGQVGEDGKIRMAVSGGGGYDVTVDTEKLIQQDPKAYRDFVREEMDDMMESLRDKVKANMSLTLMLEETQGKKENRIQQPTVNASLMAATYYDEEIGRLQGENRNQQQQTGMGR